MSIKHSLLALLQSEPRYGYQLKTAFETETGGVWPLNIGQVYTTLARCERDGLVSARSADAEGKVLYEITALGKAEVSSWFEEPVQRESSERDELAIKIALAIATGRKNALDIIQEQRSETMRQLQSLTRQKRKTSPEDLGTLLVIERQLFDIESESRWLDLCESKLLKNSSSPKTARKADQS